MRKMNKCLNCGKDFKPSSKCHAWQRFCSSKCRKGYWYNKLTREGYYAERFRKYRKTERGRASIRNTQLKIHYGLTLREFNQIVKKQKGLCPICKNKFNDKRSPCVDHNHKTGQIRGVLCSYCNGGLGLFEDNCEHLKAALDYLSRNKGVLPNTNQNTSIAIGIRNH